jgi:hypothetical protein
MHRIVRNAVRDKQKSVALESGGAVMVSDNYRSDRTAHSVLKEFVNLSLIVLPYLSIVALMYIFIS